MAERKAHTKPDHASVAYLEGDFGTAVRLQREVVEDQMRSGSKAITARKLLALYLFNAGQHGPATDLLMKLGKEQPEDSEIPEKLGDSAAWGQALRPLNTFWRL